MNVSNLHSNYWGPAVMRAFGENASTDRYTRHAFRHLAASRWFRDGVDRAQACKWGGWKDIATMEKIYIHCMPGSERKSVAVMCNRDYLPPAR
jgi:integrase